MFVTAGPLAERLPARLGIAKAEALAEIARLAATATRDEVAAHHGITPLAREHAAGAREAARLAQEALEAAAQVRWPSWREPTNEQRQAVEQKAATALDVVTAAVGEARAAAQNVDWVVRARDAAALAWRRQDDAERAAKSAMNAQAAADQSAAAAAARRDAAKGEASEQFAAAQQAAALLSMIRAAEFAAEAPTPVGPIANAVRAAVDTAGLARTRADFAAQAAESAKQAAAPARGSAAEAQRAAANARDARQAAETAAEYGQRAWLTNTQQLYWRQAAAWGEAALLAADRAAAARTAAEAARDAAIDAPAPGEQQPAQPAAEDAALSPPVRPTEPGAVPEPETCEDYYQNTRRIYRAYSLATAILPVTTLFGALWLASWLASRGHSWPSASICIGLSNESAFDWLRDVFANGDLAGRLHFSVSEVSFAALCLAACYFGLTSTIRVLNVHQDYVLAHWRFFSRGPLPPTIALWIVGAAALAFLLRFCFAPFVDAALQPFLGGLADRIGYCAAHQFEIELRFLAFLGALAICPAVIALALGAATIAFRFERNDINGNWSDSYVLREKLNALLTLLFVAAALLVVSNVAFGALLDWAMQISAAAKDTGDLLKPDSASADVTTPGAGAVASAIGFVRQAIVAVGQTISAIARMIGLMGPPRDPFVVAKQAAAQTTLLKPFETSITSFTSAISSVLLIVVFVPSFMALIDDINIAGKTHASYDASADSPPADPAGSSRSGGQTATTVQSAHLTPPYRVAGWNAVSAWKAKHGLNLSVTDLTSSFLAVAAPLISSTIVDLSKVMAWH